jgi:hypothetical protein
MKERERESGEWEDGGYLQKVGLAEVLTGIDGVASELLFDAEELVVLGQALRAAGSASLDLTSAETDNNVGNGEILGLTGAVRDHDTPAGLLGEDSSLDL